jgi:hypothetical protein
VNPLDIVGLILFRFRHRAAVLCAGGIRRTYAERTAKFSGCWHIDAALLAGYGLHASKTAFPLLLWSLFRIRTFRGVGQRQLLHAPGHRRRPVHPSVALSGWAWGSTPIQSGLLIMPQAARR